MVQNDQIISIPSSPASTSTSSASTDSSVANNETTKDKKLLLKSNDSNKTKRYLRERARSCRQKTLESEICRTIQKYTTSCLSDDRCRRIIAIAIMILAIIGLYHIIVTIL